uniref:NADH dehydrogenase subunit 4L n=1 Tax=Oospira splendens TaxID=1885791 RepID=A0A224ABE1_9EUPU|nr:NADH dehydrogenase subunit 4L [Oospira splendens]
MFFLTMLSLFLVVSSLLFWKNKSYFISSLLILENMMLISLLILIFLSINVLGEHGLFLLVLTFSVAEAALGLSILVGYIKINGNQNISALSFN